MTETAKLEALKPCPFCGEHLQLSDGETVRWWRHPASKCPGMVLQGIEEHPERDAEAIAAWNRRSLDTAGGVGVKADSVRDAAWEECAVVADVTAKTLLSIYEGDGAAGARDVAAAIRKLVTERNTP